MKSDMRKKENAESLSFQIKQHEAELAVINSVMEGLVKRMNLADIYTLVGDKIRDFFDAQSIYISTFDLENNTEHFQYIFEKGRRFNAESRPIDKFRKNIIDSKKVILQNENFIQFVENMMGSKPRAIPGTKLPKSVLFVPLMAKDQVKGYISLQNVDREHAFTESDVRLLVTLSNSVSVALENAHLFSETTRLLAETEQRNAELAIINSVQEGLVAEMNLADIYTLVGDQIRALFDAQSITICTFDHENHVEHFQYNYEKGARYNPGARPIDKFRKRIIESSTIILINENFPLQIESIIGSKPQAVPGTKLPKSALFVPLLIGDYVLGYVSLQNVDREHAFSDSDVRLLSTLSNSMSVALENARLFNETEQRNAELAVINSVQEGLVREMNMEAIYSLVGNRICEVLKTQTMIIRTFDLENKTEKWAYAIENGQRLYSDPKPLIWANSQLLESKKPLLINENYVETSIKYGGKGYSKGLPPKSAVFVPMFVGDTVMGSISLQNVERENAFSESDVRLLTTLTNSMSVALENARLFNETTRLLNETEKRATELQTVNQISRAMVSQLEFDALIVLVGDLMKQTFNADIVYIALYDRNSDMIHFPYQYGETIESRKFEDGFTERIITTNQPLLINKDIAEVRQQLKAKQIGRSPSSFLGVPIQTGAIPNGVISVQSMEIENRFDEDDLRLMSTIAANVSVAMQNAEAYRKLRSALDELKVTQEQLVQQEKLASLGQLTAGIAHEIKNPLNFVNNFSDLSIELIDEVFDELNLMDASQSLDDVKAILTDVKSNLKIIYQHGSRADGIVKSMLLHSRGGSGKPESTDLNALLLEYVNLAFHGMRALKNPINVRLDFDLDQKLQHVDLIPDDFSRVVLNLCNNAFDAMREKTKGDPDYLPAISIKTESQDNKVILTLEDNGPGIPENIRDKILQPFFTTKKGTDGTGLGLSITNDIIKAHGGTMEIETREGHFTRFSIHLNNVSKMH